MRKKKHQFHCARCNSPCEIYKKGKGHRVLVCPGCGILATNPIPLALLAAAAPAIIEGGKALFSKREKPEAGAPVSAPRIVDRYTTEERVHDALRC